MSTQMNQFYFSDFQLLRELPDGTRIVRLPKALQRPISQMDGERGACSCSYCKLNPNDRPMWDALAVPAYDDSKAGSAGLGCYTVHHPERSSA